MRSFTAAWPRLKRRIAAAPQKLLLLDFDGTLAPIAKTPDKVVLKRSIRSSLERLELRKDFTVCIISGRSVGDLKRFFGRGRRLYIGNHGFEFEAKAVSAPAEARRAKKLKALIWLMSENLKEAMAELPGILVEDKRYTLSLHFRNVPKEHLPLFRQKVKQFRQKYRHLPLEWRTGKKVWGVRPRVAWDKGRAALHLWRQLPKALPIVIGDDTTDEDMFRVLRPKAITIRVGRSKRSAAEYFLASQARVRKVLDDLYTQTAGAVR